MAEHSYGWTTGTTGDGTATMTQADYSEQMKVIAACKLFEGVAPGYLNSLLITGASSPVSMNTGGAMVDGKPYKNDAAATIAVPTPATLTRIDRLVLRADWANHLVRLFRIAGTEGGGAPAITQTPGTTYDIKLFQASITTGGVITLTDERTYAQVQTAGIAPSAITTALIADANLTFAKLAAAALVQNRQGGSATDWTIQGTNNYTPTARVQVGTVQSTVGGNIVITFPVVFSNKPVVFVGANIANAGNDIYADTISATQATLHVGYINQPIFWLAIGPA